MFIVGVTSPAAATLLFLPACPNPFAVPAKRARRDQKPASRISAAANRRKNRPARLSDLAARTTAPLAECGH
jgi:hypothetical protein